MLHYGVSLDRFENIMADIEYYYSAHSVFAHLGSARLMQIAKASGRKIIHKPVDLNAVVAAVNPQGFRERSKAHRAYYFGREIERWSEYRDVYIRTAYPPSHYNDTTLVNSMLIAGITLGHNVDQLAHLLLQGHWADHADLAHEPTLEKIAQDAGFDAQSLLKAAKTPQVAEIYAANTAQAIELSVFGSPTYVVDNDMFYGQDRLEMVERAVEKPFTNGWKMKE